MISARGTGGAGKRSGAGAGWGGGTATNRELPRGETADIEHLSCAPGDRNASCHFQCRKARQRTHCLLIHVPVVTRHFLVYVCGCSGAEKVLKAFIPTPVEEVEQHVVVKRLRAAP